MKKSLVLSVLCAALFCLVAAPSLFALDAPGDDLIIKAPEGMKVKERGGKPGKLKKSVPFPHSKHAGFDCTQCHHTWDGTAAIQACTDSGCHDSLEFRSKENAKDIKLVENAFHKQCLDCHRSLKKEKKATGPTACGKCHNK